jgi:hypothetical protein
VSGSVLIVGATSDIGRALARAYAAENRALVLAARDVARLEPEAANLRLRHSSEVRLVTLDILDDDAQAALIDSLDPFPDTVVCVAGLMTDQAAAERDPAAASRMMRTNYEAPSLLLGRCANRMEARGSGCLIGISSVAGDRGRATNYVYGSAKAGFTAFLSGLRNRLARSGVHVMTVKPGFVRTRMTEGMKLPGKLTAEPEEVAAAVIAAEAKRRDVLYVRPIWRPVMTAIRLLPETVFKKMKI